MMTLEKGLTVATVLRTMRRMPDRPTDVLTSAQLARHYGVSTARVRQWVDAGCPVVEPVARDTYTGRPVRPYFRVAEVDAWRAANRERIGKRGPTKRAPDSQH